MKKIYDTPQITDLEVCSEDELMLPASPGNTTDENLSRVFGDWEDEVPLPTNSSNYCWEDED